MEHFKLFSFWVLLLFPYLTLSAQNKESEYVIAPLPSPINTGFNEFGPSLTADGKTMYFYSKRNSRTNTDIFKTNLIGGRWSTPVEVNELNSPYDDQSPFVFGNEQFIVFSSNRDGSIEFRIPQGIGVSRDIYYSENIGGKWTDPAPLSGNINTEEMEENPFVFGNFLFFTRYPFGNPSVAKIYKSRLTSTDIHPADELPEPVNITGTSTISAVISPDGKYIYYSSNRPGGYGGYDIYRSEIFEDGTLGDAENLGPEINTAADEAYMIISPIDKTIYFCRRKDGGNKDYDIYSAVRLKEEKQEIEDLATGITPSRPSKNIPPPDTKVEIPPRKAPEKVAMTVPEKTNPKTKTGNDILEIPIKKVPHRDKELEEITETLKEKKKLTLRNINFEINSSDLLTASLPTLNKLAEFLDSEKSIKIKVTGHTDLTGDVELNQQLSWDRAESVKKYLVSKGISAKRIVTDGKGSTQPLINDTKPESNRLNRRTEFDVID
jgi:outer membrane protein OmpA-like peptidoglycan-associated protein